MKFNLDVKTRQLSNGMRVVLIHKPDYVKSLFLCGFGVGGFNIEEDVENELKINRSGIAHFLEHQMFRYQGEDVTNLFAKMQAQTNAFTSYTETAYYFSTTADVEKPLGLLLDFVQNLDINEQTVEKEKGIILSEYNMYDQNPEMRMVREIFKSMYHTHPLTVDVLGTVEDIQNMSVEDLSQFYHRNYDPSKLVLVGVTGKDTGPILDFIEEYECRYPSLQNVVSKPHFGLEDLDVAREEFCLEMEVSEPYVCVGYKLLPCQSVKESLKKDLMFSIWLDALFGPMNPEYQSWIDEEIISSNCWAEADFSNEHGYVIFYAQTNRVDAFIHLVNRIVSSSYQIEEDVFNSLKAQWLARSIRSLDHFESLAIDMMRSVLLEYDYFEEIRLVDSLSLDELNDFISKVSFKFSSKVTIVPKTCVCD